MTFKRNLRITTAAITLLVLILTAAPAFGAPASQSNLLQNAGFEAGTLSGWEGWSIVNNGGESVDRCLNWANPSFGVDSGSVHSGSYSATYSTTSASHNAGLFQTVNVTAGTTYRFTIWAKAVSADQNYETNDYTAVLIGIDPSGGRDASSGAIVWSGVSYPMGSFSQLAVEATATGSKMTVFTRSQPNWCLFHNDVYFDDASLTVVGSSSGTPATQAPSSTQAPADDDYVVATEDASGRIVHTVQEGDTLGSIASLYGVTVSDIVSLNNLASDNLIVLGQQLVITGQPVATQAPAETEEAAEEAVGATAEAEVTATEQPTEEAAATDAPTEVAEVTEEPEAAGSATLCVLSYEDSNGNGTRDAPGEPNLAGITFVLNSNGEMLDRYTTDGVSEPYCFLDLTPGSYEVSWTGDAFTPTTEQTWQVDVQNGDILSQQFGAQPEGMAEAETEAANQGGLPNWAVALLGSLGVIVFLSAVGAAGYFLIIKPRMA